MFKSVDEKIRFAIIGTNFITKSFLESASMLRQFELSAIYSRNIEKGKEFTYNMKNVSVFDYLEELADEKNIDAVYIASPNYCHAAQSIQMLKSGKHVLCEKPIASNHYEWESMLRAAIENKVVILEAMRPVFTPGYQIVKENLKKLGQIRKVNFSYCQYSSRYDRFKKGIIENAFKPELSNGALMDIGVYCVGVMVSLFGKPKQINANGYILPDSIDGMGSITATYEGMQADLVYSKITDSNLPCEIQGEKGTMYFNTITAPQDIIIKYRDASEERFSDITCQNNMIYEIETFIEVISGKRLSKKYNENTSLTIEILDEARKQIGIIFPADSFN